MQLTHGNSYYDIELSWKVICVNNIFDSWSKERYPIEVWEKAYFLGVFLAVSFAHFFGQLCVMCRNSLQKITRANNSYTNFLNNIFSCKYVTLIVRIKLFVIQYICYIDCENEIVHNSVYSPICRSVRYNSLLDWRQSLSVGAEFIVTKLIHYFIKYSKHHTSSS